jgi:beta-galactosidase
MRVHAGGHEVETWAEAYRLTGGQALVSYDDGPLAGEAAVVRHGNAISIGAWSEALLTKVLESVLAEAGIPTQRMPDGVRVSRRGPTEIWMNFSQEPRQLPDGSTMAPVSFQFRG